MEIINGRKIRDEILEDLKEQIKQLSFVPVFCDVLVGDDPASLQYVRMKNKTAEALGITALPKSFPKDITTEMLVEEIKKLNSYPNMAGLIIQLPLPAHIDTRRVLDAIDPSIDVDCTGAENSTRFYSGNPSLSFPTALAVMEILKQTDAHFEKKNIAIIGKGELVGRPVDALLRSLGNTAAIIDRSVSDIASVTKMADIVISAAGKANLVRGDMIKEGAIVIDAGTSESYGAIVGDIDQDSVAQKVSFLSPVPGGVGPVTVAMLFKNVVAVATRMK